MSRDRRSLRAAPPVSVNRRRAGTCVAVLRGLVVVALLGALAACGGATAVATGPQSNSAGYVSGDGSVRIVAPSDRPAAPVLAGTLLAGARFDPATLAGKVVVLNFWASWCPPCRAEGPALVRVADATRSLGVAFLGIDIKDDRDNALAYVRANDVPYPVLFDQPAALALGFHGLIPATPPTTVVIDRHGRVAARIFGETTEGVLRPIVEQVAAERGAA